MKHEIQDESADISTTKNNEAVIEAEGKEPDTVEVADHAQTTELPESEPSNDEAAVDNSVVSTVSEAAPPKRSLSGWVRAHKKWTAVIAVLVALLSSAVVIAATDAKYSVMNLYSDAVLVVTVRDEKTKQPIPEASVKVAGQSFNTDAKGVLKIDHIDYGTAAIRAEKSAYAAFETKTKIEQSPQEIAVYLRPVGTKVVLSIVNTLSKQPIKAAKVAFGDSGALSDADGRVELVVPPQTSKEVSLKVTATGYNQQAAKVTITEKGPSTITLTPTGKVYFLSKRTGKINVMKSNLDGSEQEVVLAGTGKEIDQETVMLVSRDWKYLALKARRDSDQAKLYLIDTHTDALKVIDEGKADFSPVGWQDHRFVFSLSRTEKQYWEAKKDVIKAYSADAGKLTTIDENESVGSQYSYSRQNLGNIYILANGFVYTRIWSSGASDRRHEIVFVDGNGTKKVVTSYGVNEYSDISSRAYAPDEIYFALYSYTDATRNKVVEYEAGKVKDAKDVKPDDFYQQAYYTKVVSPSSKLTAWSEDRDGKTTSFVGNAEGEDGKEIITQDEYSIYGWFGDDYLLVSKKGSELFALPVAGMSEAVKPVKITDYHKPSFNGYGYGRGYGGL